MKSAGRPVVTRAPPRAPPRAQAGARLGARPVATPPSARTHPSPAPVPRVNPFVNARVNARVNPPSQVRRGGNLGPLIPVSDSGILQILSADSYRPFFIAQHTKPRNYQSYED